MNPYHIRLLEGHGHAVRALAAHGRTLVSGSYDSTVRVWDIVNGECRFILTGHTQKGTLPSLINLVVKATLTLSFSLQRCTGSCSSTSLFRINGRYRSNLVS